MGELELPEPVVESIFYEFDGWYTSSGTKVDEDKQLNFKQTITAKFKERSASPTSWFTYSGSTLTGFSSEYLNMQDAPTDIMLPDNAGGARLTNIGESAFQGRNLLTSIIIPNSYTFIRPYAFNNCNSATIYIPDSVTIMGPYSTKYNGDENRSPFNGVKEVYIGGYMEEDRSDYSFGTTWSDWEKMCKSSGFFARSSDVSIQKLIIKDGVTKIGRNSIGRSDHTNITKCSIKELYVPNSVTEINLTSSNLYWIDKVIIDNSKDNITWSEKENDKIEYLR